MKNKKTTTKPPRDFNAMTSTLTPAQKAEGKKQKKGGGTPGKNNNF